MIQILSSFAHVYIQPQTLWPCPLLGWSCGCGGAPQLAVLRRWLVPQPSESSVNIVGIFAGVGADICGDIHVRCWRKAAAVRLVVPVVGCRPRWLVVSLVLLGFLVVVLLGVIFKS